MKLVAGGYINPHTLRPLWSHGSKLLSVPEGWEGCDQDAANHSLTLFPCSQKWRAKMRPAWLHSLPVDLLMSKSLFSLPLRLSSHLHPTFPVSPRWWQSRRTQRSVISWLTPGLGCVTPAAVKRRIQPDQMSSSEGISGWKTAASSPEPTQSH